MPRRKRGRRNFGVTVDDTRFESFVQKMLEMGKLELRVGILRAGTKYPPGWVGRKSRDADNPNRFSGLQAGERERSMLAARRYRKALKRGGQSFKRKARKKRVDVAKVAAVVGFKPGKPPVLPSMWIKSMERHDQFVNQKMKVAMETALRGASGVREVERVGARLSMAYKADVIKAGHTDTRLLLNTINWEVVDVAAQAFAKRVAAARRKARKLAKKKAAR